MKWQADLQRQWAEISSRIVSGTDSTLRFAVLAAHPDDETIGASALLARFPRSLVVYLTDGAPRDRRFWPAQVEGTSAQYAELRRKECAAALAHAGIESRQTFWLGGVDQEAIFDVHRLAEKFAGFLAEHVPHAVVTHSYEGGHPDHDA
ncbi:MAG TPA: PIG-L family deacetylase, partial [Terriglobales bacterium]|nr:PIG-L family deacetylase [Terriglobales bacterium]